MFSVKGTECVAGDMVFTTIFGDPEVMGGNIPYEIDSLCGNQCAPSGTCEFDTCFRCCVKSNCKSSLTEQCTANKHYWSDQNSTMCTDKKMLDYCYLMDNSKDICEGFDSGDMSRVLLGYYVLVTSMF